MELYKLKVSKASLGRYDMEYNSDSSEMKKEFDDLIHEFLTDGFIDEKERSVLIKKAQKLGIDPDEADLYITAQQQKYDNVIDSAKEKAKGNKCPHCGKPVHELTDLCPYCFEPMTPSSTKEFNDILNKLEDALVNLKSGYEIERAKALVERYVRKAKLYYNSNPKVKDLLFEIDYEMSRVQKKLDHQRKRQNVKSFFAWLGAAFCILFTIAGTAFFIHMTVITYGDDSFLWGMGAFYFALIFIIATVFYIKKVCVEN